MGMQSIHIKQKTDVRMADIKKYIGKYFQASKFNKHRLVSDADRLEKVGK